MRERMHDLHMHLVQPKKGILNMKTFWKKAAVLVALIACMGYFLTACNTVEGAGRDIEDAGEGIQDAAD